MDDIFTGNREAALLFILGQKDEEALWDITPHREPRSKKANAYLI